MSLKESNSIRKNRLGTALLCLLTAILSTGLTLVSLKADSSLSHQFSSINSLSESQKALSSSVRMLNYENRDKTGEGILDEIVSTITCFQVDVITLANRIPSYYRLKSSNKAVIKLQCGCVKLPKSPLALNQNFRI